MDEISQLLGIPSAEAEAVRRILEPTEPRQPYANAPTETLYQYQEQQGRNWQREQDAEQQAEIQRRISLPTASGSRARTVAFQQAMKTALYEKQAKALMDDLHQVDPADPDALSHQDEVIGRHGPIARQALTDPRIANLIKRQAHDNEEFGRLFDADPALRQEYANLRTGNMPPAAAQRQVRTQARKRADRLWFASQGGDPAEVDAGLYNDANGMPDRAKMAFAVTKKKAEADSLLTNTERKALDTAAEGLGTPANPDDPEAKRAEFNAVNGRDPKTEAEWQQAYKLVASADDGKKKAMRALVDDLTRAGRRVPSLYEEMITGTTTASVQNAPRGTLPTANSQESLETPAKPLVDEVPLVNSPSDLKALIKAGKLPPGSRFRTPDGKIWTSK